MTIIYEKINKLLAAKGLSINQFAELLKYKSSSNLYQMLLNKKAFSKNVREKIFSMFEVSEEEFDSWIIASKYDKITIQKAVDSLKNRTEKDIDVFTQNVDRVIAEKGTTRNALGIPLKYDPSGVRKMISGEITRSLTVIKGLSDALEIPLEDLQGWVLADKYSLNVLESALKNFS